MLTRGPAPTSDLARTRCGEATNQRNTVLPAGLAIRCWFLTEHRVVGILALSVVFTYPQLRAKDESETSTSAGESVSYIVSGAQG